LNVAFLRRCLRVAAPKESAMFACSITFLCTALMAAFAGFIVIQQPQGAAIAQQVFLASLLLFAGSALAELFQVGQVFGFSDQLTLIETQPAPITIAAAASGERGQ
jgi:hypothetical protein